MKREWVLMKCPTCGLENKDDAIFCDMCEVFLRDLHLPLNDQISAIHKEDIIGHRLRHFLAVGIDFIEKIKPKF